MNTELLLIINIAVSFTSAFIAAYLTSEKFVSEKWWERKVNSYIDVLENLAFLQFYYNSLWHDISATTPISKEQHFELYAKYLKSKEILTRYCATKEIFISKESCQIIDSYLNQHEKNKPQDFPLNVSEECDYYTKQMELIDNIVINFREAAKKELKSKKLFKPIA